MDKTILKEVLIARLEEELELLTRAAIMAREEATSPESKAESQYDTRGQEAAYLAESQAKIAAELKESIEFYDGLPLPNFSADDIVNIGAVICLESRGRPAWYFLGPRNGGLEIDVGDRRLIVVTPQSPLGSQLQGAKVGTTIHLPGRTVPQPYKITAIE